MSESLEQSKELIDKLKRRHIAVKRKKLDWAKRHRIYFHKPLDEPDNNQSSYHASNAHVRLVIGTNRSGKTTSGAVDDISFALGFYPWLLPEHLKSKSISELMLMIHELPKECLTPMKPPVKVLVIVADWDTADEIWTVGVDETAGKFKLYIPPDALVGRPRKNNMGHICQYVFKNGSILQLDTQKSYVNDRQSFEGKLWHKVHYDEPPMRGLRVACSRGLVDTRGYEDFTMTPLTEPWIKDEIFDKASSNVEIDTFFFSAESNPYISKEGWKDYLSKLDSNELAARARGEWIHLRGLIYKEFIPRRYDPKWKENPEQNGNLIAPIDAKWIAEYATILGLIDPHPRNPHAVLFLAADKFGRRFVWDEIYNHCLVGDLVDLINGKLAYLDEDKQAQQLPVFMWLCDPLAFIESPIDGLTWADEFIENGIPVEKAPKRREQGILMTRNAFKEKNLLICDNCDRNIFELQHYRWSEYRGVMDRNPKEKPEDKDDHMVENLYRGILMNHAWYPATEDKPIESFQYV